MKKITKFIVLAVFTLTAGLALAVQQLDESDSAYLHAVTRGVLIAPASLNVSDARINANRITRSLGASATIDFVSGTIVCTDSTAITVSGARAGDVCLVGAPASPALNSTFSCYVSAADAVKVRHCPAGTAVDPASNTYYVRVFSAQ